VAGFNDGGVGISPVIFDHARAVGLVVDEAGKAFDATEKIVGGGVFNLPLYCQGGLQRSDYNNKDGIPSTTYYLA
jgi:hypothetical protein